ncbi:hypothetical protein KDA23_04620 [Candidatus Saccharibacteria bacterium]|nr:hypothetical protein [Candidatus Saccharibacteria bacterium]
MTTDQTARRGTDDDLATARIPDFSLAKAVSPDTGLTGQLSTAEQDMARFLEDH